MSTACKMNLYFISPISEDNRQWLNDTFLKHRLFNWIDSDVKYGFLGLNLIKRAIIRRHLSKQQIYITVLIAKYLVSAAHKTVLLLQSPAG